MRNFNFFIGFFLLIAFTSCAKESHRRIKYRVNSNTTFDFIYTVNGNSFIKNGKAGDWQSSYRMKVGSDYFLSAVKTGPGFELSIFVYADGTLIAQEETDEMWKMIKVEGIVN